MKKIVAFIALLAVVAGYRYVSKNDAPALVDVPEVSYADVGQGADPEDPPSEPLEEPAVDLVVAAPEEPEEDTDHEEPTPGGLPAEFNLAVPFTSQAPHANWDLPYQESCEEASAYMVSEYYAGTPGGLINANVANAAILATVAFEEQAFGFYLDTTAQETVELIEQHFGYSARVVAQPTVHQIKAEIAAGRPVIIPAAGKELGNPFFVGDGPLYHMFVIKGYTETSFITNDPGTRRGENLAYDIDVVMAAIGDWNDGDPANGEKVVIFTSK